MAKFAAVVLLALFAFQAALARPHLAGSDSESLDIVRAAQDVISSLAAKKIDQSTEAARDASEALIQRLVDVLNTLESNLWFGAGRDVAEAAKTAESKAIESAQQLAEKLASLASAADRSIELVVQSSLSQLADEAEAVKALLPTIKDTYTAALKNVIASINDTIQKDLSAVNKVIQRVGTDPTYVPNADYEASRNAVRSSIKAAKKAAGSILKNADAAVEKAISALA